MGWTNTEEFISQMIDKITKKVYWALETKACSEGGRARCGVQHLMMMMTTTTAAAAAAAAMTPL